MKYKNKTLTGYRPRNAGFRVAIGSSGRVIQALFKANMGWLIPLVIVLLLLAGILAFLSLVSPIAPFVYPLF